MGVGFAVNALGSFPILVGGTDEQKEKLDAMRKVRREVFVPAQMRDLAYDDTPLPIAAGQTISLGSRSVSARPCSSRFGPSCRQWRMTKQYYDLC